MTDIFPNTSSVVLFHLENLNSENKDRHKEWYERYQKQGKSKFAARLKDDKKLPGTINIIICFIYITPYKVYLCNALTI